MGQPSYIFSCKISRYSALISKMLKYAEINIVDITVEHLDNTIEHIRWLSHS